MPALSIVVIGRNEGERLRRCLRSANLARKENDGTELIYVDSASSDESPRIAGDLGARVIALNGGIQTAARARNAGWERASAPYILFLDGDTILDPHFIEAALQVLQSDGNIAAVWGHRREQHPEHSIYNRVLDLDWIYPAGDTDFCGGDVLMRRSALLEAEGYDPSLSAGEEPELCRRLRAAGYRIVHVDAPMTLHDLNMTHFSQYWRRSMRAGYAYAEVSNRFRQSKDPFWLRESRRNLCSGSFWIVWLAVGLVLGALQSLWFLPWLLLMIGIPARSAWKARLRAPGQRNLLLLYGIHSQLQQIPILVGQLRYFRDRYAGKPGTQIQYKGAASA
jgi:GT2 family glycosyltransferase